MPHPTLTEFDQHVLDMIEASPVGAVPRTPAHQAALAHLVAAHQVYPSADYADGYVTVRTLTGLPTFHADQLEAVLTAGADPTTLDSDDNVFDRYLASLPEALRSTAETLRPQVVGRRVLHRAKHDGTTFHDPVHSLFLVPGGGLSIGLPGNYLYGAIQEDLTPDPAATSTWSVHLHDRHDGAAACTGLTSEAAFAKLEELLACAPFLLSELDALDFRLN